jgi:hypothetical protein
MRMPFILYNGYYFDNVMFLFRPDSLGAEPPS